MTDALELALREHLDRQTTDVPGGPDLDRSVRDGRRRRRNRALGTGAAALAVVAVLGTVGAVALAGDDAPAPGRAEDRAAAAPSDPTDPTDPTDFVPGTDVDERFAALVAEVWPALPAPDDVYPSDADTAGPLPDAEVARATEWQAVYTPEPGREVLVLMGFPVPGEDPTTICDGAGAPAEDCRVEEEPAGSVLVTQLYRTDDGFTHFTTHVDDDGFRVSVLDTRPIPERSLEDVRRVRDLVADPRFTFQPGS